MNTQTLAQKLLEAQREIEGVTKSSDNPFFHSKYADLNSVLAVVKPVLNRKNILIANSSGADQFGRYLETSLIHVDDNQQIASRKYFSGNEKNLQELGAADTYARRFNLTNLLSLEALDDDGESAVGRGVQKTQTVARGNSVETKSTTTRTAGVQASVGAKRPTQRAEVEKKITLTSKVLLDQKKTTQEELEKILAAYGAKDKTQLTDEQALAVLTNLQGKLK